MIRTAGLAALLVSVLLASCGGHASRGPATEPGVASVDADTLWDPNAPKDPIVTYRLRIAVDPDNPALHNNLGNLYVLRNWLEEAVGEYKRAIDLDPTSPAAWNNLGTTYLRMGKKGDAMGAFRKAVKLEPRYALGWYNIGVVYDRDGKYDAAIEMYLKAASLRPEVLDPRENPQVVSNSKMMAVQLRRYLEEKANLALPLDPMPE